jgi:SAM-dependent methyltransferase
MLVNHIYDRKVVVSNYDKTRDIPIELLYKWLNEVIEDFLSLSSKKIVRFLEVGVGTGMISFPVINILSKKTKKWFFFGIDNSKNMLKVFIKKLKSQKNYKIFHDRIAILNEDIEKEPFLSHEKFDFILLGGVLHCLKNPERTLNFLKRQLKKGGFLIIIIQPDNFMKFLAGKFEKGKHCYNKNIPKWIIKFWKAYHRYRGNLNIPIDKRAELIYSVKRVKKMVGSVPGLCYIGSKDLVWRKYITPDFFIYIIRNRLYFAVGQNLSKSMAIKLANKMKFWLNKNKIHDGSHILCVRKALIWRSIF